MKRSIVAAILLSTSIASAAPTDAERALATQLFKQGKALMMDGKYADACPKLEESQRLDPGGGTILNLALCREQEGRTATAWSLFHEALAYAKRDGRADRRDLADEHIAALEPKLARVLLAVKATDATITLDGVVVAKAAWDSRAPLDPGEHRVEAAAAGKITFATTVVATAGGTTTIEIAPLVDVAPAPPPLPPSVPIVSPKPTAKPVLDTTQPSYTPAWVAAGVSFVAFGATGYLSLRATSSRRASDAGCTPGCTEAAVSNNDRAKGFADVATVTFTIGAAALATAVVLYIVPPRSRVSIGVAPTAARLTVYF